MRDPDYDPDAPKNVAASLSAAWDEMHIEPDEIDQAVAALRAARSILGDRAMMKAIRARLDENRDAAAAGKE